ncbi:MAG: glycerophosphodiester phosphodiesterase family protein [Gammaproteobacteria bacterium]|nr:glycerophosphodiester phosphodiesterase family protein [Gammaproteobacteria bacterium]MDH3858755.1 glycerophosphodiester phosphodiesterase family protein [Gammaproteobacteria bacterium]
MQGLRYRLELAAQHAVDLWMALIPRQRPGRQALQNCRIISHRGEHDNRLVKENTMAAFARVADADGWGIEFDVRWTRDLEPVVIHDVNTSRVFNIELDVAKVSFSELREQVPEVPALAEVVDRFGGSHHLMVELKQDELGLTEARAERLQEIFTGLTPGVDYHFLGMHFDLFELAGFAGNKAFLPVAELNTGAFSRDALARDFSGVCGHYLLLNRDMIRRHHAQGQKVGVGFVASRFCFYRELNRDVDWIFTNHAVQLIGIRQRLLRQM